MQNEIFERFVKLNSFSGLTLNMAFSIYLPYRFSVIYFSTMWTATAPSATAVTT